MRILSPRVARGLAVAVLGAALVGCSSSTSGTGVPDSLAASASAAPHSSADTIPSVGSAQTRPVAPVYSATAERALQQRVAKPAHLTVGDIDIDMTVSPVGILDNGDLEIPDSAQVAGWWRDGAAPGEDDGVALIAAHVDDREGVGPFASLKDIREGASVEVMLDDGTTARYEVSAIEQTSKTTVDFDRILEGSFGHHLVLVTCGGDFNWNTRHYDDNVIVWAERIND